MINSTINQIDLTIQFINATLRVSGVKRKGYILYLLIKTNNETTAANAAINVITTYNLPIINNNMYERD